MEEPVPSSTPGPTTADHLYLSLRRHGASTQRATRIVNAAAVVSRGRIARQSLNAVPGEGSAAETTSA